MNTEVFFEDFSGLAKRNLSSEVVFITDEHLYQLYSHLLTPFSTIVIESGEDHKVWASVEYVIEQLLKLGVHRKSLIVGFGGGMVTDLTGFVASVYMRGINFALIPTSLLGMVDAAIGGKTAINFKSFKNIIGTFSPPKWILLDEQWLNTLPEEAYRSGLSEVLKYALITNNRFYQWIYENTDKILKKEPSAVRYFIEQSQLIKRNIVETDPYEKAERKWLNFGHTLGHAIENQNKLPHGLAVAVGMMFASEISVRMGLLKQTELDILKKNYQALNLPSSVSFDKELALKAIFNDKKRTSSGVDFILLKSVGEAVTHHFMFLELKQWIDDLC